MSYDPAPLSKTAKYKKITKPLLERKRRARINRCLDELKDLMVGALEIDDDNLSKLEKADILELTVNHLTKLHSPKDPVVEAKKFQAGFGQCAAEACRFIMSVPDLDEKVSQSLVSHLSRLITAQPLTIQVPDRPHFSPPTSPASVVSDRYHHYSDHDRSSSDAEDSVYSTEQLPRQWGPRQNKEYKQIPPLSGLLTTVDKLAPQQYVVPDANVLSNAHKNGTYMNRVPAEAKDVILQKIRQHIMEKRGNEGSANGDAHVTTEHPAEQTAHSQRDHAPSGEPYQYSNSVVSNDTLDLRKIRTPTKCASPEKRVVFRTTNQLGIIPPSENKVEATPNLPEQCELPMDYSNLPPKKKRKLIEYQEYKKQEEAKRQLEAFYAAKKEMHTDRPTAEHDEEGSKWRPW